MSEDPGNQQRSEPPEYRVYGRGGSRRARAPEPPSPAIDERSSSRRSEPAPGAGGGRPSARGSGPALPESERPYTLYHSRPRGLRARLRGESDPELELERERAAAESSRRARIGPWWRRWSWRRAVGAVVLLAVGWVALSFMLFMISSGDQTPLPAAAVAELSPGGNMLTSANTVLILGIDERPLTGPNSKEPGADHSEAGSNTDTIMLWRVGGGTSRRLSIPRDTVANIPGHGLAKINDGFAIGQAPLAIKTIEDFTGLQINHVIIVNLGAFPPFIDAIGGINVATGKVCAQISGGAAKGGFTLNLNPGVHHMDGIEALTYARIRENPRDPADSDLTRVLHQQEILNAIGAQLHSPSTFLRLPWASWQAPKVLQSDMGGLTLMSLFAAAEMGGSPPPARLTTTAAYSPTLGDIQEASPSAVKSAVATLLNG